MKLTTNWQLTISACLVIGIFLLLSNKAWAVNYECEADNAPWNRTGAMTTGDRFQGGVPFACMPSAKAPDSQYTRPLMAQPNKEGGYCGITKPDYGCAWCPKEDDICARIADCSNLGDGFKCIDMDPYNKPKDNNQYECVPYHCPYGTFTSSGKSINSVCCRIIASMTMEEEDLPEEEPEIVVDTQTVDPVPPPPPPDTQTAIGFNIASCCSRSIVRELARNSRTGIVDTDNYTMNDIVQAAINVYECILCIVGALMLIMIILGAVMLVISGGSSEKVSLGKKIIVGAVVGGIIAFATYLIIYWTVTALGAKFVNPYNAPSGSGDLRVEPGSKANF